MVSSTATPREFGLLALCFRLDRTAPSNLYTQCWSCPQNHIFPWGSWQIPVIFPNGEPLTLSRLLNRRVFSCAKPGCKSNDTKTYKSKPCFPFISVRTVPNEYT